MASAPLNWLLKIGSAALKTTEQTLTGAVNELKDLISSSQSQTDSQFSAVAAAMSKKVNKTDVLNLEEIEATTDLTDKVAAAEAVKEVNDSLTADNSQVFQFAYDSASGKYGYKKKEADTDVFVPFSGGVKKITFTYYIAYGGVPNVSWDARSSTYTKVYYLSDNALYSDKKCTVPVRSISLPGPMSVKHVAVHTAVTADPGITCYITSIIIEDV